MLLREGESYICLRSNQVTNGGTNFSCSLRHYATDALYLDDFWFVKQRTISKPLPALNETLVGASVVPWRYNFNTGKKVHVQLSSKEPILTIIFSDFLVYICLVLLGRLGEAPGLGSMARHQPSARLGGLRKDIS